MNVMFDVLRRYPISTVQIAAGAGLAVYGLAGLATGGDAPTHGGLVAIGGLLMGTLFEVASNAVREHPELTRCRGEAFRRGEPASMLPAAPAVLGQLEALGFHPIGVMRQRFFLQSRGHRSVLLAAPDRFCFANVWTSGGYPRFYLMTPFLGDGFVITAGKAWRTIERPDCVEGGVDSEDPAVVLAVHAERVEAMKRAAWRPYPSYGLEDRVLACKAYWRAHSRNVFSDGSAPQTF